MNIFLVAIIVLCFLGEISVYRKCLSNITALQSMLDNAVKATERSKATMTVDAGFSKAYAYNLNVGNKDEQTGFPRNNFKSFS